MQRKDLSDTGRNARSLHSTVCHGGGLSGDPVVPDSQADLALEITGLSKSYRVGHVLQKRRPALRDLSLKVLSGEVFGYLGPNGAGKTTTLKIVMGLLSADAGSMSVLGLPHSDRAWRFRVGYLPENPYFYDYLTAAEYLDYVGKLSGMPSPARRDRRQALLEQLGLIEAANVALRRFSKGMVQRVGLAQALMNDPELIILDEPMSGLDPIGRRLVRDIILGLKSQGKTIFFSTHILPDAETLCDRVGLLKDGQLLKAGRLDEILRLDVSHMEVLVSGLDDSALDGMPELSVARIALGERVRLEVGEAALGETIKTLESLGGRILAVYPVRQSLEEYFFREMGPDAK